MYTGQVDTISNRATWASKTYSLVDKADGTVTDLTNPALTVDIVVTVREMPDGARRHGYGASSAYGAVATASIANGKVSIPGPGFNWQFEDSDLSNLCPGTYRLGVKITINGFVVDLIIGTIGVIEGN